MINIKNIEEYLNELISNTPDDFKNSIDEKNIKYYFLNSIDFQNEVRKIPKFKTFQITRLNGNDVIGKTIKHDNNFNLFINIDIISLNSIQKNIAKQIILHEFSHIVFDDYKLKYNLEFNEDDLTNIFKYKLVDLIDEYYAQRKSLEIIIPLLNGIEKQDLLKIFKKINNITNHIEFKCHMNYMSTIHAFDKKIKFKNLLITNFNNKLKKMYDNDDYNIDYIFDDFMIYIDNNNDLFDSYRK